MRMFLPRLAINKYDINRHMYVVCTYIFRQAIQLLNVCYDVYYIPSIVLYFRTKMWMFIFSNATNNKSTD